MLRKLVKRTRAMSDEAGATSIEYGLIASLIGMLLIASISGLGGQMRCTLYYIASAAFNASVPECGTTQGGTGGEESGGGAVVGGSGGSGGALF